MNKDNLQFLIRARTIKNKVPFHRDAEKAGTASPTNFTAQSHFPPLFPFPWESTKMRTTILFSSLSLLFPAAVLGQAACSIGENWGVRISSAERCWCLEFVSHVYRWRRCNNTTNHRNHYCSNRLSVFFPSIPDHRIGTVLVMFCGARRADDGERHQRPDRHLYLSGVSCYNGCS